MPKLVEYPHCSWENAIRLAETISDLGNNCSSQSCAAKLGMSAEGGGFNAMKTGAVKFGLISNENGKLATTSLFNEMHLAYDNEKKRRLAIGAFLSPPLFKKLWEKYRGRKLPTDMLSKILAADFGVMPKQSERIAFFFESGAKTVGLLGHDATMLPEIAEEGDISPQEPASSAGPMKAAAPPSTGVSDDKIIVSIQGGGMQSHYLIEHDEDLELVEVAMKAIRRKINRPRPSAGGDASNSSLQQ
jgi:hypothetical protein